MNEQAILKFHQVSPAPLDSTVLAAAVEVSPHALAITENGNLIYKNPSFAQLMSNLSAKGSPLVPTDADLQTSEFSVAGRKFSLSTVRSKAEGFEKSDLQHLAMIGRLVAGVAHDFSLHQGCECLRAEEFSAVIVDQWVTEAEPGPTSVLFDHLGPAVPVFVNFGISGVERILRELRAALSRRGCEMVLARHVARQGLRDELKNDVTALLLSCDVALQESELSDATADRLYKIWELANQIKTKLAVSDQDSAVAGVEQGRAQTT